MSEGPDMACAQRAADLLFVPEEDDERRGAGDRPYREALQALAGAAVRHCLLRDDPRALGDVADLDILVEPGDLRLARAELERAGFVLKRDRRRRCKWVFVRYVAGRFYVLDVHARFVQAGIEYMDARCALARCGRVGAVPSLGPEDQFLHLVLHNLLGKSALQEKHLERLRALRRAGLERARLEEQARPFGLEFVLESALDGLEDLAADAPGWRRLRRRARRVLLRRPGNRLGAWRHAHGDRLRWRRRSVVLALLGPDGSGKTTFADALEAELHGSPLGAGRVYMGCWGHDLLPMRQARRLVPPQVSYTYLLAAACGMPLVLTPQERDVLAREGRRRLAFAALRHALKGLLFHAALGVELFYRYWRHVALSRRSIVIADRWVQDLEFRHGRNRFVHGGWARGLLFRLFPTPDGILYLHAPYDLVARRKPQLDRQQFEAMDRTFRALLGRHRPLEIRTEAPPAELARAFLARHWELLVERCNARA